MRPLLLLLLLAGCTSYLDREQHFMDCLHFACAIPCKDGVYRNLSPTAPMDCHRCVVACDRIYHG